MKKILLVGMLAVAGFQLAGCTPGHNTTGATAAGAVAGGLGGNAIFGNSAAGIIGGALVGGIVGNQIGNYMDRQDEANMQRAVSTVPVGQQAQWTNNKGAEYTVRPIKNYRSSTTHRYCREYQTTVTVNGKTQKAYGKACRQPDGSWKLVS